MPEKIYQVNAFTANGENGNPAGVVLEANGLDEPSMLAVAAEAGFSETAFVTSSDQATRNVRFFTPTTEVPLCGHATIATWSLLHRFGEISVGDYTQETKAGILKVEVQDNGLIFMEQTKARFFNEIEPVDVAAMLGLAARDFHTSLCPQIVSTGIKDLLVPVASKEVITNLQADLDAIADFSHHHDISGFHVFALLEQDESLAAARNFAPADGIPEECATGTSNGALLCYLRQNNMLPTRNIYRIEQGEAMGRLSYVYGTFKDETVWIGGEAEIVDKDG